eukprot:1557281-Pleurochrysis_carterae.AAC.5
MSATRSDSDARTSHLHTALEAEGGVDEHYLNRLCQRAQGHARAGTHAHISTTKRMCAYSRSRP